MNISEAPTLHFRRIGWKDTLKVIELSHALLPRELCRATHSLFALFVNFERKNTNLSFGLFVGDQLVGYMLVYFLDRSLYHDRQERIVHIDEYCVLPEYRGRGREVISKMVQEFELFKQGCGIEAIATGGALDHWLSIGRVVSRWGYETNLRENDCERAGHSMGRIRWEFKEEDWRPSTPMKLPKAVAECEFENESFGLLQVKNTRQWLSLRDNYQQLSDDHTDGGFEESWQWWRHFGISEELRIYVVKRDEHIICIVPLSKKPGQPTNQASNLSLIASNSSYSTAHALYEAGSEERIKNVLKLFSCEGRPFLEQEDIAAIKQSLSRPSSASNSRQQRFKFAWFGLNRRNVELQKNYEKLRAA